jgi:Ca2+:H+ antiporter
VTLVTAFCAEFLVSSIEETANRYHIPKTFIGLILLPIVGNAAEVRMVRSLYYVYSRFDSM